MARLIEDFAHGALLADDAAVHHEDAAAHAGDHAQVVGDHDDGRVGALLQVVQQIQHLGLNGHIQRGGGLVGDDQLGLAGDGRSDHHALAHAAGELVGVLLQARLGVGYLHALQKLQRSLARLGLLHAAVDAQGLGDLILHRVEGIQAGHGILEDHADLIAAHLAELARAHLRHLAVIEADGIGVDVRVVGKQAHDGHHGHALARAGLAHDAQRLARVQVEGNIAHGLHAAHADVEVGGQVLDL